ncbi:hypothetical protein [Undibacterium sp.]|uniref:hypothetical protein n=1 Tax=Undibacterium sp. TaxID=1914977 RepID=UPI0025E38C62|nr:hypothetical protein [Undibacterium sp.]
MKKSTAKGGNNNPFKNYQQKKVTGRETAIQNYLKVLRRTRAKYEYVTDLAKAVAEQLTLVEGKACDHSTLLRNPSYKALLLNFLAGTPGLAARNEQLNPVAEAHLHAVTLDVGNLKKDNERLRAYIFDLEAKADAAQATPVLTIESRQPEEVERQVLTLENNLGISSKALWLVLEHYKDLLAVDRERNCIIDLAALRQKNVIVDAATAAPFMEWLRKNANVG